MVEMNKDWVGSQTPRIVRGAEKLKSLCVPGEEVVHFAMEVRLSALLHRRVFVAATTNRLIIFRRGLIGGFNMKDLRWQDISDAKFKEHIIEVLFGSLLMVDTVNREKLKVNGLVANKARPLYVYCQHQEQAWREKNRVRKIEEDRAKAGGVQIGVPLSGGQAATPAPIQDPQQRLQRAKSMLDQGLLSDAEYEALKAKILAEL